MPDFLILDRNGTEHKLFARPHETLMQIARAAGLPMAGECNGSMACATCHVIVAPEWAGRLAPPGDDEEATLDTLFNLTTTSRLGCQIRMTDGLDGLTVRLPER
ncbi:MAG: 2Fe-2S iron-sulfur cluster-binding protein [Acidiphilium sp.]|nr:2Fe-2S iron-sulfur cluster-binding protein [Acidiphilium sp.]MDD4936315.1 2Fe-2S iron-sulfur cluster-binding protein [Acidiphilium sp.]